MIIPRGNTMGAVNPASVSGYISINGQAVPYSRGRMVYKGVQYLVSDDHGLVIDTKRRIFGAVIAGELTPLSKLSAAQLLDIQQRYGVTK